ncbi:MAG: hypothetical protein M0005_11860 [Actinomycetota bacterium]|nr:hypothetical protein [Actinomycetota bacterium]
MRVPATWGHHVGMVRTYGTDDHLIRTFAQDAGSSDPAAIEEFLERYEATCSHPDDEARARELARERMVEWLDAKEAHDIPEASRIFTYTQLELADYANKAALAIADRVVDEAVVAGALERKDIGTAVYRVAGDTVVDAPDFAHQCWADMAEVLAHGRGNVHPATVIVDCWHVVWMVSLIATRGGAPLASLLRRVDLAVSIQPGERPGDPVPGTKVRIPRGTRIFSDAGGWPKRGVPIERARTVTLRFMAGEPEEPVVAWFGEGGRTYWSKVWEVVH